MGYRLDIYKNIVDNDHNLFYGTKLIGYMSEKEEDLYCVKYLCSIREDIEPEDFGYYYSPEIELNFSEFKRFIMLYFFDLAQAEIIDPLKPDKPDYENIYNVIDYGRLEIAKMLKNIMIEDKIIVRWC